MAEQNHDAVTKDEASEAPMFAGIAYLAFLLVATISILMIAGGIWQL